MLFCQASSSFDEDCLSTFFNVLFLYYIITYDYRLGSEGIGTAGREEGTIDAFLVDIIFD